MVTSFAGLHSGANSVTGDFSLGAKAFISKKEKSISSGANYSSRKLF